MFLSGLSRVGFAQVRLGSTGIVLRHLRLALLFWHESSIRFLARGGHDQVFTTRRPTDISVTD